MKAVATAAVAALMLAGCAASPKKVALKLDDTDPAFTSTDCRMARDAALHYDDKVLARMGTGLALGLFLGPFGLPFAAMADAHQNEQRKLLDQELARRCTAHGQAVSAVEPPPSPVVARVSDPAPSPAAAAPIPSPAAPPAGVPAAASPTGAPAAPCRRYGLKVPTDPSQNRCAD